MCAAWLRAEEPSVGRTQAAGSPGQGASPGRCQPAPAAGMCSPGHSSQTALQERTCLCPTFVPGEMELRSRHLCPGSTALQHPTVGLISAAGTGEPLGTASTLHQHRGIFTRKLQVLLVSIATARASLQGHSAPVPQNLQSQTAKR